MKKNPGRKERRFELNKLNADGQVKTKGNVNATKRHRMKTNDGMGDHFKSKMFTAGKGTSQ